MKELKLEYENGKPVMRMDTGEVCVIVSFAKERSKNDPKETIVEILTSQYMDSISNSVMCRA